MIRSISLTNIRFETFVGCLESERGKKNLLDCQVTLRLDHPMGSSLDDDALENTIDYRVLESLLLETAKSRHFQMLESLGQTYLEVLLARFPQAKEASITLRKPGALPSGAVPEVIMVQQNG